jgi:hypothetical protein
MHACPRKPARSAFSSEMLTRPFPVDVFCATSAVAMALLRPGLTRGNNPPPDRSRDVQIGRSKRPLNAAGKLHDVILREFAAGSTTRLNDLRRHVHGRC